MTQMPDFRRNDSDACLVAAHLRACDDSFVPSLSGRVDLEGYSRKIVESAERFEAWIDGELVGLVATYCNDLRRGVAFITSVSVLPSRQGRGIASRLLVIGIDHVRSLGIGRIELEVDRGNTAAMRLYEKHGFSLGRNDERSVHMYLEVEQRMQTNDQRDYNVEMKDSAARRYVYGFDFDVMHPFMIKSFRPFFNQGSLLELGSFKGDFTKRFLPYFNDVTCVEASSDAIAEARQKLGDQVTFIEALFEKVTLPKRYDNIVLTHVLEHLDDPVLVLKRINDEWLAPGGRLFLVCPNANAPSRQIAVKMGLITHNAAVTRAEAEHGHRCTYSLDTLERDAVAAGLNVVHRSGIFFKALANFQWDRLLQSDIISKEYLEGCYRLGQLYPDLCSSIFLMCEQGT